MDKKNWMSVKPERTAFPLVREMIMKVCADRKEAKRCILVCDEIFQNIIEYSSAGRIWFRCESRGTALKIVFMDDGKKFDPVSAKAREREFEELGSGGMGLTLVRTLGQELKYERVDDRNVLSVVVDTKG